jgi:Leucine-rich repeat (LRR) protein
MKNKVNIKRISKGGKIGLDLSGFKLTDFPEVLKSFPEIQFLYLSNNRISHIPGWIEIFQYLEEIDLSYNRISSLSKNICKLYKLKIINLGNNCLNSLPNDLGNLPLLKKLSLNSNRIHTLPQSIVNLTNIEEFTASNNKLKCIPNISNSKSIRILYFNNNLIENIPEWLFNLINLEQINLAANNLVSIPLGFGKLEKLNVLNIGNNKATILPRDLFQTKRLSKIEIKRPYDLQLRTLNIAGNLIHTPPMEIIKKGIPSVNSYFKELKKGFIYNDEIKLILLGNSTSGKTSLSKFLKSRKYSDRENTTHGIRITRWVPQNADIKVNIWDFGGQEYYHATHRLFLSKNAVYIVLWDKTTNINSFINTSIYYKQKGVIDEVLEHFHYSYWIKNTRYYTNKNNKISKSQSPILIVQNKCEKDSDDHNEIGDEELVRYSLKGDFEFKISLQEANKYFSEGNSEGKIWSLKYEIFEDALVKLLKTYSSNFKLIKYWVDLREDILKQSKTKKKISIVEFELACKKFDNTPNIDLALIYLRDISGIVLYFPNNEKLKNWIYVDSNWINSQIYNVLSYDIRDKHGKFTIEDVQKALSVEIEEAMEFVSLMKEFDLIFEDSNLKGAYIAPQYLAYTYANIERLESEKRHSKLENAFTLKFPEFLPRSVIARIIAKKGLLAKDEIYWKFGLLYIEDGLFSILIECKYEEVPKIEVSIQKMPQTAEKERNHIIKKIFELIYEIVENESNFSISLLGKDFVKWSNIEEGHTLKSKFIKSENNSKINTDFFNFIMPATKNEYPKIFISYSHADSSFKDEFKTAMIAITNWWQGDLMIWDDQHIRPGMDWNREIENNLEDSDIVVCLLSTDFLASDYCKKEMITALKMRENEGALVIPILVRPCAWEYTPFASLQFTNKKGCPITLSENKDVAWTEVSKLIFEYLKNW